MRLTIKKSLLLTILAILLLMVIGATYFLPRLLHLDSYRDQILAQVQQSINRQVVYEKGDYSFQMVPTFTFTKVVVKEKDGRSTFLSADRFKVKLALLPLLEKRIVLRDIILERPVVELYREQDGRLNISDLLEEKPGEVTLHVRNVHVRKGSFNFTDRAAAPEALVTRLAETDLNLEKIGRGKTCTVKLATNVMEDTQKGSLDLNGKVTIPGKGKSLDDATLNVTIKAKNLNATKYWPYYGKYVPFRQVHARLDLESTFKGKAKEFKSRGKASITGLRFDYPQVFRTVLTPKDLHFNYDMETSPRQVNVKALDLTLDGLNLKGSCALHDIHTSDPRITASATTSKFNLQYFAPYIPYGIIVKDTADFIEQHIKGGIYKLDEGRLDGRVSQILHMERGTNYDVLYIKARVQQGIISYGPQVPAFNGISGTLEMRGKDFNLIRMAGNFGTSPFNLEGKITDYPIDIPSGYPFTMIMTPRQAEVAWLLGPEHGRRVTYSGDAPLRLTGEGFTSGYRLTGEWNLGQAAYSFPGLISKPTGLPNTISFAGSISKQEAKLSSLNYKLAPMDLTITAGYRFADKPQLDLAIKSNQFPIQDVADLLPKVRKYQPAGSIMASVRATSPKDETEELSWSGNIIFNGFACKLADDIRPLSNLSGTISFNGNSLETSQLTTRIGSSTIYGKGSLVDFSNPTINLTFFSPLLDLADFGLSTPQKDAKLTGIQGNVAFKNDTLQIKSLSTKVNNTSLDLAGTLKNLNNPIVDLTVTASYLDVGDIILLAGLEPVNRDGTSRRRLELKANVKADAGKFLDLPFNQLKTNVLYENRILYLQPLDVAAMGGHISGKARIDFSLNDAPRYQLSYTMENASAEQFTRAIGIKKQEIKGNISMQGDLTAKGKTADDIIRTSLGSSRIRVEKGLLRQFPTLSKVFSLLNVSQLLKFQLPDMVSGGMPFNEITGTLAVRDGIISTSDLFIKSDAINISAVGSVDLVKEELDVTLGTQPLQTLDKLVSRIPIVGWILTGGERTLITAYFVARGSINDPVVTAIPADSMAKGVFDIFKRIFQLPAKLITNTGEVIIGK